MLLIWPSGMRLNGLSDSSQAASEGGTQDEPSPSPQGVLLEPEAEDIKTVSAGDTIYASATSFEDLRLSEDLLKVRLICACEKREETCQFVTVNFLVLCSMSQFCSVGFQGIYTEMKFEKPSRIQALTLPMIVTPPYRSLIAQVSSISCLLQC